VVVAVVLAAILILPLILAGIFALVAPDAQAVTQSEINSLRSSLNALKDERARVQREISALRNLQTSVYEQTVLYKDQIDIISEEVDLTARLISDLNYTIAQEQLGLEAAKIREEELTERYIVRVKAMEAMGDISYLSVILQADSLTDLLTRYTTMRDIMASDKKLVEELIETRQSIENTLARLAADKQELFERTQELDAAREEWDALKAGQHALMREYMAQRIELEADERNLASAEAEADKELKEAEAELQRILEAARRRNNPYVGGAYEWPLPGYYTVGSQFGMRLHPVYKVQRMHNGIDVSAPRGTPIVAANAGEILTREYSSGYGNYIVIDHGGGQQTLYGHMSSFASNSVGSRVARGEVIGYVGTTGVSTGNHLHFEVIVNGARQNPMNFVSP
jgi:murein DD-endopeptidase MepM/ murein hydrolase activator NlpD